MWRVYYCSLLQGFPRAALKPLRPSQKAQVLPRGAGTSFQNSITVDAPRSPSEARQHQGRPWTLRLVRWQRITAASSGLAPTR